jgi:hypothetical protein
MSGFLSTDSDSRHPRDIELSYPLVAEVGHPSDSVGQTAVDDPQSAFETYLGAAVTMPFLFCASEVTTSSEPAPPVTVSRHWLESIRCLGNNDSADAHDDRDSVRLFVAAVSLIA